MQAPTALQLLANTSVRLALEEAWLASQAYDPTQRHEEGGWIYLDIATGAILARRAAPGAQAAIDLTSPPLISGAVIVATFHTHPNPSTERWEPGPSAGDTQSAFILGVPCLIRADDGYHSTGPDSRRGGLMGPSGFPS